MKRLKVPKHTRLAMSEPRQQIDHSERKIADTEPSPETPDTPDDAQRRVGFWTDSGVQKIDWTRFKSERGRLAIEQLVRNEAERLGYVLQTAASEQGDMLTCDVILSLYNSTVIGSVVAIAHVPPKLAEILAFDEQQKEAININGAGDRLVKKYIGSLAFKYADEIMVSLALAPLLFTKFQMFKHAMQQFKSRGPIPVQRTVTTVTGSEGATDGSHLRRPSVSGQDDAS